MPIDVPNDVQDWFAAQKVEIQLYPDDNVRKFRSLSSFHDFLQKEAEYWQPIDQHVSAKFDRALAQIVRAIAQHNNEAQFQAHLTSVLSTLAPTPKTLRQGQYILFSDASVSQELKKVFEKYGDAGYKYFLFGTLSPTLYGGNMNGWDKNQLFGLFDSYVYQRLNERLGEQLENGQTSLADAQSKFAEFLTESDNAQSDRQKAFAEFVENYSSWKNQCDDEFKAQATGFDATISNQLAEQQKQFDENETGWTNRIADLEELYQQKLMLKAPADYWTKLEKKHRETGNRFAWITGIAVVLMTIVLSAVLYNWPPSWMNSDKLSLSTLKGSFILLAIISLALYIVHFLAKFTISSYHLARDAEERKQLTYVYLALLQEQAVDPKGQEIILNALFSRADTGLLKGDHSPTMPGGQVLGMFGKGG